MLRRLVIHRGKPRAASIYGMPVGRHGYANGGRIDAPRRVLSGPAEHVISIETARRLALTPDPEEPRF